MLRIVKNGAGGDPIFACDHCKQKIEDIELALFSWKELDTFRHDEEGNSEFVISPNHPSVLAENGQIYTLHKDCIDQFEAEHGGDDFEWPCLQLIDLLIYLMGSCKLNIEDIQKRIGVIEGNLS